MSDEPNLHDVDNDSEVTTRRAQPEDAGRSLPAPRRRGLAAALINIARGRWSRATNVIVAASRVAHLADRDQRAFRRETQDALGQVLRGEVQVALVVEKPRDLAAINYCQQGDYSLYSEGALHRRAANRADADFVEAVREWWRWLPKAQTSVLSVVGNAPPPAVAAGSGGTAGVAVALPPSPFLGLQPETEGEGEAAEIGAVEAVVSEAAEVAAAEMAAEAEAEADAAEAAYATARGSSGALDQEGDQALASGAPSSEEDLSDGGSRSTHAEGEQHQQHQQHQQHHQESSVSGGEAGVGGGDDDGVAATEDRMSISSTGSAVQELGDDDGLDGAMGPPAAAVAVAVSLVGSVAAAGSGGVTDSAGLQVAVLDEPIYSAMVVVITWVLLPKFGIPADPEYDPSGDWLDDNEGLPYMDFKHFFDSMFDLADMWSVGVEAAQYVDLLVTLLQDVRQLEASQAAFTQLLHKFRSMKQQPTMETQLQPLQPLQPQAAAAKHPAAGHPFYSLAQQLELKPDPRLPSSAAVAVAAVHTPPRTSGSAVTSPSPSRGAVAARGHPSTHPSGSSAAAAATAAGGAHPPGAMAAATPIVVAFPARSASVAPATTMPYSSSVSAPRAASPARASEAGSTRREGAFKTPQYSRVDVAGVRSPLADYLRSGAPQPDRATLEQWRQNRTSNRSRAVRAEGSVSSAASRRARTPSSVALNAELLLGPHSPGGRDAGDGGVLMYEEYMHDMAARYLAQQQRLLVDTSASAAAAAGQLLAAAAANAGEPWGAPGEAGPDGAAPGALHTSASVPVRSETVAQPSPPDRPRSRSATAETKTPSKGASKPPAVDTPVSEPAGAGSADADSSSGPATSTAGSAPAPTPPRGSSAASTSSRGTAVPALVPPPPLPPLTAPTLDYHLLYDTQSVCVVGHAVQPAEQSPPGGAAGGGAAAAVASRIGGSRNARTSFRRPNRTASASAPVSASGGAAMAAAAAADATAPTPVPPPPPGPAQPESPLEGRSAVATEGSGAASPNSHTGSQAAGDSGSATRAQAQAHQAQATATATTQAQAQAQAQVVVAFAAAAYRLNDPNVHSLLLPTRLAPTSREGGPAAQHLADHAHNLADGSYHTIGGGGGTGGRTYSPGRLLSAGSRAARTAGSPPYSPYSRTRASTAVVTLGSGSFPFLSGTALERMVPYMGYVVPSPQRAAAAAGGDGAANGGDGAPDTGWLLPQGSLPSSNGAPLLTSASVSPPGTPSLDTTRRNGAAAASTAMAGDQMPGTLAILSAGSVLNGALPRRLTSASTSRAVPFVQGAPTPQRPAGQQSWGTQGGEPLADTELRRNPPDTHHSVHVMSPTTQPSPQYYQPTQIQHQQHQHQQPHQWGYQWGLPSPAAVAAAAAAAAAATASPAPASPAGPSPSAGGPPLASRWSSSPQSQSQSQSQSQPWSPALVQTPRAALRASGSTAGLAAAAAAGGGGGGGGDGGIRRRLSAAPGLSAGGGGSFGSGGVVLPSASAGSKLRAFYSVPPVGLVGAGTELPAAAAAGASSRRGSRSTGHGEESPLFLPSVTDEPLPMTDAAAAGGGGNGSHMSAPASSLDFAAWRRSLAMEHPGGIPGGGGGGGGAAMIRSPVRIRSSDPVGFADAVTAARMNVAIMADALLQRQAEQRTQAKLLRERALHLRPTTASAARHSHPNAFSAFLAREAGLAAGGAFGDIGG